MMINQWERTILIAVAVTLIGFLRPVLIQAQGSPPSIDRFTPEQGVAGTPIRLFGRGLSETTDVLIGTEPAVFQVLSDNLIIATVPLEARTGTIQIVTSRGIAVSGSPFTAAPFIEELNPEFGSPNENIIISGRNLGNATAVHFGEDAASFLVLGENQLSARVPNTQGLREVIVTTPVATASSETLFEATGTVPFVREFMPEFASPGTTVTVNGKNFIGTTSFRFGSIDAQFAVTADTQLQLVIPPDAPSGPVTLTNANGESTSRIEFQVIGTTPYVEEIKPDVASPGDLITIEGINFTGTTAIRFGEAEAEFTVTANTQIQVTVPEEATSGPLRFDSIAGESTSSIHFNVNTPAPFIEDFEPPSVSAGQLVRINGRNFIDITTVLIGETEAEFAVVADNQLSVTTPQEPITAPITLTNPGGITTSTNSLVVTGPEPSISLLDPAAGLIGDVIMIEGGNFATATNVWFGNLRAEFSIIADNQLQAVVPNNAETNHVLVDNPGGRAQSEELFHLPARIDSFEPDIATPGDLITVVGANFLGATGIQFGSVDGFLAEIEPNQLTAQVPPDARIGPIAITNPAGITGSLAEFQIQPLITQFTPPAAPAGTQVTLIGRGFSEVTQAQLGPLPAPFEIRSSTEIVATVPINGFTSAWRLSNPSGTTTATETFTVIESADLSLDLSIPEAAEWNTPYRYQATIRSLGPTRVENARVTIQLPPGSVVTGGSNSHGACEAANSVVTCTLLNLSANQTATIDLTIQPTFYGLFSAGVTLENPLFDPTPTGNELSQEIEITGPTPSLSISILEDQALRLSWPRAAANYLLQQSDQPTAPESWQTVERQPTPVDADNVLQLSPNSSAAFFRLLNPEGSTTEP